MCCHLPLIKPLPIIFSCHRITRSLNHCQIWKPYPAIMDYDRKRSRNADGDESDGFGALESLSRPISPPRKRLRQVDVQKSPWQLTRIRDLPEEVNKDTVSIQDLLGDPLIRECWQFNFLHDIPFVMNAFDESIKHLIKLHVVHGFWKRSDLSRIVLSVGHIFPCCCNHMPTLPHSVSLTLFIFTKNEYLN